MGDDDPPIMAAAFRDLGWDKPIGLFRRYRTEHGARTRHVLVADSEDEFAGYVTVRWQSEYPPFAERGIPEIVDLNVLPAHRSRGVGTALLDRAEALIAERGAVAGLGVGLYGDYGAAQRLYARRGYRPDGRGVVYRHEPVTPGAQIPIDDDAALMLTRALGQSEPATDDPRK